MATAGKPKAIAPPPPALPAVPSTLPSSDALAIRAEPQTVGLQTSGHDLKVLLERTGYQDQPTNGAEKLDLLVWMADQVKENVRKRKKMKLALKELNDFLVR